MARQLSRVVAVVAILMVAGMAPAHAAPSLKISKRGTAVIVADPDSRTYTTKVFFKSAADAERAGYSRGNDSIPTPPSLDDELRVRFSGRGDAAIPDVRLPAGRKVVFEIYDCSVADNDTAYFFNFGSESLTGTSISSPQVAVYTSRADKYDLRISRGLLFDGICSWNVSY